MNIALLMGKSPQLRPVPELLARSGYRCNVFETGRDLIHGVSQVPFDLLLIDDELPDLPAIDVIRAVRCARSRDVPIIMLASDSSEDGLVDALDAGADDYVCRPLNARVLMARITALRRRVTGERLRQGLVVRIGPYQLNSVGRFATLGGERIEMTPKEFDLAMLLFSNVGRVLSSDRIQQAVWRHELPPLSRALAGLVSRLRKTLRIGIANGVAIAVVYAHGYRLDVLEGGDAPRLPAADRRDTRRRQPDR
ncbi:response regulator transcription factor [Cupriavidus sp. UYPR2.512]|uniref:response regulator transcription factor n=1 Tax=Cupriavidus sp. UYPR2.512 TaxID=1080187 RepID=UPI000367E8EB|nr:response regulator transcription factor [Cupriavidus sp. UYPR2.512]UIF90505.1 response regulator transcription factor [Cupriavidus necator]